MHEIKLTFVDYFKFAPRPTGLNPQVTFVVVSSPVTPAHRRELEGALAGTLHGHPLHGYGLHLLSLLLGTGSLGHRVYVVPGEASLLPHQTLVGEGDVPEAVSTAHRVQDLGALDGLALGGCVI